MTSRQGFSLVELVVVMIVVSVGMVLSLTYFREYADRTAARNAAGIFSRDLILARSTAMRERSTVSIVFDEPGLSYVIRSAAGRQVGTRSFAPGGEFPLTAIDLGLTGDSVAFDARGIASLTGAEGAIATALFEMRGRGYTVSFSALGASEVQAVDGGG